MAASGVVFRQIIAGPIYVVCNVQSRSVFVLGGGGGGGVPSLWWVGGGPSYVLVFIRITSLCGVTSLISWGSGCPVSRVRALLFLVAL